MVLSFPAAQVNGGSFLSSPSPASHLQYDPDILFDKGVTLDSVSDLYPLPPEPRDMAMGDLNGDSLQDVVVVFNGSYLYIFNGTSDGRLDPLPWNISLAAKNIGDVRSVAIGDLNNDGKDDIALSYSKPNARVSILYQDRMFNAASSTDLIATGDPYELVIGDFSQDGKNDIAVVLKRNPQNWIYLFRNPFDGSPENFRFIPITGFTNSQFLSTGHIDSDGYLDLLVASRGEPHIKWFAQPIGEDWVGATWTETTVQVPGKVAFATLADVDGGSQDDIVSINSENSRVEIRYNDGAGGQWTQKNIGTSPGASALSLGRLSPDNIPDLSILNGAGNNCSVYCRTAANEWRLTADDLFPTGQSPLCIISRDDGTPLPGVCILSAGVAGQGGSLCFYPFIDGHIVNSDRDIVFSATTPAQLAHGSLMGHPQVLATIAPSSARVILLDVATWQRVSLHIDGTPSALVLGDFDGNGYDDIAVAKDGNKIQVFNGSTDLFVRADDYSLFDVDLTSISCLVAGDTGAGVDILVAGGADGVVVVSDALEGGHVQQKLAISTPGNGECLAIGAFFDEGEGGDIAVVNATSGNVEVFERDDGSGTLYRTSVALFSGTNDGVSLTTGDYNGDGLQDLAMSCRSDRILVYLQTDTDDEFDGFFDNDGYDHWLSTPSAPMTLASGDLNDDGYSDLIAGRGDIGQVNVYLSKAGASFLNAFNLTAGCTPSGLLVGDINGDGRDDLAASSSGSKSISMWFQNNLVPVAGASLSSSDIQEGESVSFDASASQDSFSDRDSLQYLWNFGDGNTSTGMVADHIYEADGSYDGYLIVTDRGGLSDRVDFTVVVTDIAPISDFVWEPRSPLEGEEVRFRDNSTSYDGIVAYEWDFDEDGTIDSREKDPIYTFHSDGTYRVRLTVHEEDGGSNLSLAIIEVRDRVPVAGIGPLSPVQEGTTFTAHDASISYDEIVFRQWDFGDGTKSNDLDPAHYYNADGTYVITLTVRDADGDESVATATIEVLDSSPSANFEAAPNPVSEGSFVSFSDNSSAFDRISSWHWDFGDGNTSDERNPTHAYTIPKGYLSKVFTVTLTVTDGDGSTSQRIRDLTVLQTSPVIISLIAEGGAVFNEDQEISFLAHAQKTNFNITGYAWDFDYDPSSGFDPVPGVTVNRTYWTYPSAGEYRVCLRVYDYNSYSEQILVVTVRNLAPVAELSHVKSSDGWVTFDATRSTDTPSDLSGLTFRWNFGDGKGWTAWSPNATIVHQFDDGSYTVTVQVRDGDGAVAERGITISIDRLPPEIGYDGALPTEAYIGDQIRVEVNVTDRSAIAQVVLFYTFGDETRSIPMTRLSGTDLFVAIIPSFNTTGTLTYHVEATDSHGYSYDTTAVQVTIAPRPDATVPLIVAALAAAILLSMFLYVRMYRMVIDEVFVIYHDGNLIAHQTRRLKPGMDDQVLGSMLAAVQSFVRDSFKDEASTGLNRLDFGEKKILVERGQFLIVAAVLHGKREGRAAQRLKEVLRRTETKYADVLTDWDGDLEKLRGIKEETNEVMRFRIRESLVGDGKDSEWPDERGGAS